MRPTKGAELLKYLRNVEFQGEFDFIYLIRLMIPSYNSILCLIDLKTIFKIRLE